MIAMRGRDAGGSRQYVGHDFPGLTVQQRAFSSGPGECELVDIDAEEMEQGGVIVVMVDDILHGFVTDLIGLSVDATGLHPTAGKPGAEAISRASYNAANPGKPGLKA